MRTQRAAQTAWISGLALFLAVSVSGCATSQEELMPVRSGVTMSNIWHNAMAGQSAVTTKPAADAISLQQARSTLRRPLKKPPPPKEVRVPYTRTAVNEIYSQFHRLPNPDLTLYIFPHLSGGKGEQVPIPGYTTLFPLYTRPHYALPGEKSIYRSAAQYEDLNNE